MTVEAGLDGLTRIGSWLPVRVQLTNSGSAVRGEVLTMVTTQGGHAISKRPVELPADSRREVLLYAQAPRLAREVTVRFEQEGGGVISATARIRALPPTTPLVLIVSDVPDASEPLRRVRGFNGDAAAIAFVRPERLPDQTAALDPADILLISGVNTAQLTRAQRAALKGWVLAGGHLVLGGGPTAQDVVLGLGSLAPAQVRAGVVVTTLAGLEALVSPFSTQPIQPLLQQLVPIAQLHIADPEVRVLAGDRDAPLVVRRSVGRGVVDHLAFDPAFVPPEVRPLLAGGFVALARGEAGQARRIGYALREDALFTAASAAAAPALMPVGMIALLLLAYALLAGVVGLWLLQRLRRPGWVWVGLPITTAVFTGLVLVGGSGSYDPRPQLHRLSLWLSDPAVDVARDYSIYGVRTLRRSQISLTFDDALAQAYTSSDPAWGGAPSSREVKTTTLALGIPSMLRDLPTSLGVRAVPVAIGAHTHPVTLQATLRAVPTAQSTIAVLEGEIQNLSTQTLQDCVLLAGRNHQVLTFGDLEPQRAASARITLTTGHPQPLVDLSAIRFSQIPGWVLRPGAWTAPVVPLAPAPPQPPTTGERTPFDRSFPPLHTLLVAWQSYERDRLQFFARLGLVVWLFSDEGIVPGSYVACWSAAPAPATLTEASNVTDRSLHLWRVHPQPSTVQPGQVLPPELFTWDVKPLSGTVAVRSAGLVLNPGEYVIALESWLPLHTVDADVSLAPGLHFDSAETPLSALQDASLAIYDWGKQTFELAATDLSTTDPDRAHYTGRYLSTDGRALLKLVVRQSPVVLSAIKPTFEIR